MKILRSLIAVTLTATLWSAPSISISTASAAPKFPSCDDEKLIKKLVRRFNQAEKIYWKDRGLKLNTVSDRHFHTDYKLPDSIHERRFCHGTAEFSDGKKHRIHYLVESNAGFAGFSWNVEYCIHGLDPYRYYDGSCRHLSRQTSTRFP